MARYGGVKFTVLNVWYGHEALPVEWAGTIAAWLDMPVLIKEVSRNANMFTG